MLEALLEQPKAMFTNTDITSAIWFFDSNYDNLQVSCIKAGNDNQPLFVKHPAAKDKMKNAYSELNIKQIIKYFKVKKSYIAKSVDTSTLSELIISNIVGRKEIEHTKNLEEMMEEMCQTFQDINKLSNDWIL